MTIVNNECLPVDVILPALKVRNSRHLFQALAENAARETGLDFRDLNDRLWLREQQSTSGIGNGVAIPHLCVEGLERPFMLFAKLSSLLHFDSLDEQPVGLVFLILSPSSEDSPYHLQRLAQVSRLLRHSDFCERLHNADSVDAFQALFFDPENHLLAA